MDQLVTAALTGNSGEGDGVGDNTPPVKRVGFRYTLVGLICAASIITLQGLREILTSDAVMRDFFYLMNNYVNSTRHNTCHSKDHL